MSIAHPTTADKHRARVAAYAEWCSGRISASEAAEHIAATWPDEHVCVANAMTWHGRPICATCFVEYHALFARAVGEALKEARGRVE